MCGMVCRCYITVGWDFLQGREKQGMKRQSERGRVDREVENVKGQDMTS
jgi:hypothetical protein